MPVKIPSLKDYKLNLDERSIELTMEAAEVSREEAILALKKLFYKVDYPKKKKPRRKARKSA